MKSLIRLFILLVVGSSCLIASARNEESKYQILRESARYANIYLPDSVIENVFSPKSISHSEIDKIFQSDSIIVIFKDRTLVDFDMSIIISNKNLNDLLKYDIRLKSNKNYSNSYIISKDADNDLLPLSTSTPFIDGEDIFMYYLINGCFDIPDFIKDLSCTAPSFYRCCAVLITKGSSSKYTYQGNVYKNQKEVDGIADLSISQEYRSKSLSIALKEALSTCDKSLPDTLLSDICGGSKMFDLTELEKNGNMVMVVKKSKDYLRGEITNSELSAELVIHITCTPSKYHDPYYFSMAYFQHGLDGDEYGALTDIVLLYASKNTFNIPFFVVRPFLTKNGLSELDDIKVIRILRDGDEYDIQEHKISVVYSN